jgi:zinc D-Ala-D-Ala carboxypeptidase
MPGVIRNSTNGSVQLSPHFSLAELVESDTAIRLGLDNTPNPFVVQNLFKVASLLEQIRALLGDKVILVSSGYRSPAVNAAVGGATSSEHTQGCAADFRCPGFGTPLQIAAAIAKSNIQFGQLIQEGTWVHISIPGRFNRQVLTAHFIDGKAHYSEGLA